MNWLAAGQVKSHDSKGYETAFYWETAVDEKVLGVSRVGGGVGVCCCPGSQSSVRVRLMPAKWFYRAVVMPYWFAFVLSIEQRVVEHIRPSILAAVLQ